MDMPGTPLRAVRAALFTALVVTLSTASHVLLSGVPLPLPAVAVTAAAVFALAYTLAGRERGFGGIAALLIPLELAADTLFTTGQRACYGSAGGPVAGPLRSVGLDVLCAGDVGTPLARAAGDSSRAAALLAHAGPAAAWILLAAHVGVGLLAAAWLRRGERALAQLLGAAVAAGFRPLLLAVAAVTVRLEPARPRTPRSPRRPATARTLLLTYSLGRRGPPCSLAVTA
ncbi:hypothetical protein [Streptomyces poonensis]|uniref:Uncharacterized protein n=1 Tax=Streptomyces poonensis TaxID=68255 RepID=A0A918Q383_9ACTN|nr:hypothetical protein [Streptomyces poonensis]GGZ31372.1 hypothetical protein GCM10010365_60130 [Streptomyces poonensis]GLJ88338.1 hypothetical protein GCM10017589_09380 [Streptomyces poonensis]